MHETTTTLLDFFTKQYGERTRFTEDFLNSYNLVRIQMLLTKRMREQVEQPQLPTVEFTESILGRLMRMAYKYRLTPVGSEVIDYANVTFVENMLESMVARYYETAFWKRWCHQGIPDPNNIPYPITDERTDFTAESDAYTLNDPWGREKPMY